MHSDGQPMMRAIPRKNNYSSGQLAAASNETVRNAVGTIRKIATSDIRFRLDEGAGTDAVHGNPEYSYAVVVLEDGDGLVAEGSTFTLGAGNDIVCSLAESLAGELEGRDIESLMSGWGAVSNRLANHSQLRWLGPHKGAIHLALAAVTNACFDLWARHRGLPLWQLLLDLSDDELLALLDLSYVEDVLPAGRVLELLSGARPTRADRKSVLDEGYPAYDTSVGWINYSDEVIAENARNALDRGFDAMKLKVGSNDLERDLRRVRIIRDVVGPDATLMVDANQQWRWPLAEAACREMAELGVYWIEEPTHPDDVAGHRRLADIAAPSMIAAGEHIPNQVVFKNFLAAGAIQVCQVDALRVGGISEFLTVGLLAKHFDVPVIPHVGDLGQLHRHLVLFNHIALNNERLFLECIPHLAEHFEDPAVIEDGRYRTPSVPGAGLKLR